MINNNRNHNNESNKSQLKSKPNDGDTITKFGELYTYNKESDIWINKESQKKYTYEELKERFNTSDEFFKKIEELERKIEEDILSIISSTESGKIYTQRTINKIEDKINILRDLKQKIEEIPYLSTEDKNDIYQIEKSIKSFENDIKKLEKKLDNKNTKFEKENIYIQRTINKLEDEINDHNKKIKSIEEKPFLEQEDKNKIYAIQKEIKSIEGIIKQLEDANKKKIAAEDNDNKKNKLEDTKIPLKPSLSNKPEKKSTKKNKDKVKKEDNTIDIKPSVNPIPLNKPEKTSSDKTKKKVEKDDNSIDIKPSVNPIPLNKPENKSSDKTKKKVEKEDNTIDIKPSANPIPLNKPENKSSDKNKVEIKQKPNPIETKNEETVKNPIVEKPKGDENLNYIPNLEYIAIENNIDIAYTDTENILREKAKKIALERFNTELKDTFFLYKPLKNTFEKDRLLKKYTARALKELKQGENAKTETINATDRFAIQSTSPEYTFQNPVITRYFNNYINGLATQEELEETFNNLQNQENTAQNFEDIDYVSTNMILKANFLKNFKDFLGSFEAEHNDSLKRDIFDNYISDYKNREFLESQLGYRLTADSVDYAFNNLKSSTVFSPLYNKEYQVSINQVTPREKAYQLDYSKTGKQDTFDYKTGDFLARHPYYSAALTSLGVAATTITGPFSRFISALGIGGLAASKTSKELTSNHENIQQRESSSEYKNAEYFETVENLKESNKTAGWLRRKYNNYKLDKLQLYKKTNITRRVLDRNEFISSDSLRKYVEVTDIDGNINRLSEDEYLENEQDLLNNSDLSIKYIDFADIKRKSLTFEEFRDQSNIDAKAIVKHSNGNIVKYSQSEYFDLLENSDSSDIISASFYIDIKNNGTLHKNVIHAKGLTRGMKRYLDSRGNIGRLNNPKYDLNTLEGVTGSIALMASALSRLDAAEATGNIYLKSEKGKNQEESYRELHELLNDLSNTLGISLDDIRNEEIYTTIYDAIMLDTNVASKNFNEMKTNQMIKSGMIVGTGYIASSFILGKIINHYNPQTITQTGTNTVPNPAYQNAINNPTYTYGYSIDPGIKTDMQALFQNHFSGIEADLNSVTGDRTLWETLIDHMNDPKIGTQIKNDVLEFILDAKDSNGVSELVVEAKNAGIFNDFANNTTFSDTIMQRMKTWGYNIPKTDIANYLSQIDAGTLDPSTISDDTTRRAIAEVLFNGIQRNDPNYGRQIYRIFFDRIITGQEPINISQTIEVPFSNEIPRTTKNLLDYMSQLGIPLPFRNKYTSAKEENINS